MNADPLICPTCGSILEQGRSAGLCSVCVLDDALNAFESDGARPVPLGFVGDLELLEVVARGGMGVVYRAQQGSPRREVALKALPGASLLSREARDRFRLESQAMAALDHPGILPVFEAGEVDDTPYFTMKFASGGNLAQRTAALHGNWREIAEVMAKVADAIEFAHRRGILHRDIKPGNVLFDHVGNVFVSDFGLARLIGEDSNLTRTVGMLGTPHYLAPEIATGSVAMASPASDIWALGTVLYELLAGKPPFGGDSAPAILRKIAEEDPLSLPRDVPKALGAIASKCLEKNASRRYESAGDFADDLRRWLSGKAILARPRTPTSHFLMRIRRKPLVSALAAFSSLAVAGLYWADRDRRFQGQRVEDTDAVLREQSRTSLLNMAVAGRTAMDFGWRSNGINALREAAAIRPGDDLRDEVIRHLARWDLVPSSASSNARKFPQVSIPWDAVRMNDESESSLMRAVTKELIRSPDGRWVLFGGSVNGNFHHLLVDAAGQKLAKHWTNLSYVGFTPGGNAFLLRERSTTEGQSSALRVTSLSDLVETRVEIPGKWGQIANISDHHLVIRRLNQVEIWNWQSGQMERSFPVKEDLVTLAASRQWIASVDQQGGIYLTGAGTGEETQLSVGRQRVAQLALPENSPLILALDDANVLTVWNTLSGELVVRRRFGSLISPVVELSERRPHVIVHASPPASYEISPPSVLREIGLGMIGYHKGFEMESSRDGSKFTVSADNICVIMDSATGRPLLVHEFSGESSAGSRFLADDRHLTVEMGGRIALYLFDPVSNPPSMTYIRELKVSEDSAENSGPSDRYLQAEPNLKKSGFENYSLTSSNLCWLALPVTKDRIEVLDLRTMGPWLSFAVPFAPRAANVSSNGRWLVTGSKSKGAKLLCWELDRPEQPFMIRDGASAPKFSPDSRWLGDKDFVSRSLQVWDTSTWTSVYQSPPNSETEWPGSIEWSADSRLLAIGMADGRVRLLATGTWEKVAHLAGPRSDNCKVRFLRDGRTLLVGRPGAVEAWDLHALSRELQALGLPPLSQVPQGK